VGRSVTDNALEVTISDLPANGLAAESSDADVGY
jgi:hypothetical protein